jgi:diketogulonate reductase-like aldo/keto reductase
MVIEIQTDGICQIENKAYPAIGFGTYPFKNEVCLKAVAFAANTGYRIIDTATFYRNFAPIGRALKNWNRNEFYIISKAWPDSHTPQKLREDLNRTLKELQMPYLDAYLLHYPNHRVPIEETLATMQKFQTEGLIRHIGLSNVTVNHLKRVFEIKVPIAWIQVEMHPQFYEPKLLDYCRKNSLAVQAWAPLGRGRLSQDTLLSEMGMKYGKTASQISLRWILQHGCIPLPGSQNESHIKENFHVTDFSLSLDEMNKINKVALGGRRERVPENYGLGFSDEFDFSYEQCWPRP